MSDESAKQFEQAFKNWHPDLSGPYLKHIAEYFWVKSRESLSVELPAKEPDSGSDSQVDIMAGNANRMLKKCRVALVAAGITVKGEGDE